MQNSIETRGNLCTELGLPVENRENRYWQRAASRRRKTKVPPPPVPPPGFCDKPWNVTGRVSLPSLMLWSYTNSLNYIFY